MLKVEFTAVLSGKIGRLFIFSLSVIIMEKYVRLSNTSKIMP